MQIKINADQTPANTIWEFKASGFTAYVLINVNVNMIHNIQRVLVLLYFVSIFIENLYIDQFFEYCAQNSQSGKCFEEYEGKGGQRFLRMDRNKSKIHEKISATNISLKQNISHAILI